MIEINTIHVYIAHVQLRFLFEFPHQKIIFFFYFTVFGIEINQSIGNSFLVNTRMKFRMFTFFLASISDHFSWVPQKFPATECGILIRIILISSDFISLFPPIFPILPVISAIIFCFLSNHRLFNRT